MFTVSDVKIIHYQMRFGIVMNICGSYYTGYQVSMKPSSQSSDISSASPPPILIPLLLSSSVTNYLLWPSLPFSPHLQFIMNIIFYSLSQDPFSFPQLSTPAHIPGYSLTKSAREAGKARKPQTILRSLLSLISFNLMYSHLLLRNRPLLMAIFPGCLADCGGTIYFSTSQLPTHSFRPITIHKCHFKHFLSITFSDHIDRMTEAFPTRQLTATNLFLGKERQQKLKRKNLQ